jgi:sec-independent protein translocase protein TatC
MEPAVIFFKVCLVTGLVLSSPWAVYQVWAFVAAGLYRRERMFVYKFLPYSLLLFLAGVFICFFAVLPLTLRFLLEFNVWLGVTPMLRLTDWMGFATILPLIFGLCFQTPLVMLFMSIIGIFTATDYRAKRRLAILVIVVVAAILTPGPDVSSMLFLSIPMLLLYELGILLVGKWPPAVTL